MPINFTQIFQQSWNFVQNQRRIVFIFTFFLFITQFILYFLTAVSAADTQVATDPLATTLGIQANSEIVMYSVGGQLAMLFISTWCLSVIHSIGQRQQYSLAQGFQFVLRRFIGILALNLVLVLPIVIGLSEIFFSLVLKGTQPSFVSLFAVGFGCYVYTRLCLSPLHYLISGNGLMQSVQSVWQAGVKRVGILFVYTLMIYFLLPTMNAFLLRLAINPVLILLVELVSSFILVFSLVFTYRFYSVFMAKV